MRDGPVVVRAAVRVDGVRAVVLLPGPAVGARQVGVDLGAAADAVADLDVLDRGADAHGAPDDLVADDERHRLLAPAARDGVHVGAAHAACVDGDVDVVGAEGLERELRGVGSGPERAGRALTSILVKEFQDWKSLTAKPVVVSGYPILTRRGARG
jgi:hypothetical protein